MVVSWYSNASTLISFSPSSLTLSRLSCSSSVHIIYSMFVLLTVISLLSSDYLHSFSLLSIFLLLTHSPKPHHRQTSRPTVSCLASSVNTSNTALKRKWLSAEPNFHSKTVHHAYSTPHSRLDTSECFLNQTYILSRYLPLSQASSQFSFRFSAIGIP